MAEDIVIEVKNISKVFKIYQDKGHMLKEKALNWKRNKYEKKVVLDNVSFQVKRGEAVGLIGHNGCGKSTTLKLLTGIMYPDSGDIKITGRISSLLELGAGFHPDLSGRENIYINASIFGLSRKEIDKRVDSIIRFSELEEFIDNPVRTYSSGMYMKLAFSVAINVDADILLIDEILAVGDVNFQAKCFKKMQEIKRKGTTLVLVSHSMDQIESLCDRSIWLQNGKVMADGTTKEVDYQYLSYMKQRRKDSVEKEIEQLEEEQQKQREQAIEEEQKQAESLENSAAEWTGRFGTGEMRIENVKCLNSKGEAVSTLDFGEKFTIQFEVKKVKEVQDIWFGLTIIRNDGVVCYGTNTLADDEKQYHVSKRGVVKMTFEDMRLMPGEFFIDICVGKGFNEFIDYWQTAKTIEIFGERKDIGCVKLEHKWDVEIN